jgi:NAD(P)-dependent dehydrogenase (short-subunit alcohol dehydrogenase family)
MKLSKSKPTSFPAQEQEQQPGKEHLMIPQPEYVRKGYTSSGKLRGKKALISGGDSGIGRAIAVHFALEGADVAIIYFSEERDAEETRLLVEESGQKCLLIKGNVSDVHFCRESVEKTVKEFFGLHILVNNAAVQFPQEKLEDIRPEQLDTTFKINLYPFFYLTTAALKHLKEGDSIINTSSVTAYRGSKHLMDYAASKGGIISFTRSLSQNLASRKIRVNAVAPGPIWTPLIPASFEADKVQTFGEKTPMGRAGQPSEVAPAYVFLASEDAAYITGQVIHVNGGEIVGS